MAEYQIYTKATLALLVECGWGHGSLLTAASVSQFVVTTELQHMHAKAITHQLYALQIVYSYFPQQNFS